MVEHLVATQRRRIAVLGAGVGFGNAPDAYSVQAGARRVRGAREALQSAGSDLDPDLVIETSEWSTRAGWEATSVMLRRGQTFDGIFDRFAGVRRPARPGGCGSVRTGAVAVAGFDDIDEAQFSIPTLTTVAPEHQQIAETAVRFLLERTLDGPDLHPVPVPELARSPVGDKPPGGCHASWPSTQSARRGTPAPGRPQDSYAGRRGRGQPAVRSRRTASGRAR